MKKPLPMSKNVVQKNLEDLRSQFKVKHIGINDPNGSVSPQNFFYKASDTPHPKAPQKNLSQTIGKNQPPRA